MSITDKEAIRKYISTYAPELYKIPEDKYDCVLEAIKKHAEFVTTNMVGMYGRSYEGFSGERIYYNSHESLQNSRYMDDIVEVEVMLRNKNQLFIKCGEDSLGWKDPTYHIKLTHQVREGGSYRDEFKEEFNYICKDAAELKEVLFKKDDSFWEKDFKPPTTMTLAEKSIKAAGTQLEEWPKKKHWWS
jgi:hypothetical protein